MSRENEGELYGRFEARALAVGAEVHRYPTKVSALEFIRQFLRSEGVGPLPGCYAVWADCPSLSGADLDTVRSTEGIEFRVTRSLASQARFGISQLDWALADTGSLVQDQSAVAQRLVSSLPDIHIALVPSRNILEGKVALFRKMNPRNSRYIAFITGPSRTADIERVLTIGVHGPQRLVIVFVDELGGEL